MESFIYPSSEDLLDPFEDLPPEMIEEICYMLDERSLGKFTETSKRNKAICQRVLNMRKILSELVGNWKRRVTFDYGSTTEEIEIEDKGNIVEIRPKKYYGMKDVHPRIIKKNLKNLKSLRREILNGRYIKIDSEKDFWGDERLIYYPGDWKGYYYRLDGAKRLGLKVTGRESNNELIKMMKKELIRRNKFISG